MMSAQNGASNVHAAEITIRARRAGNPGTKVAEVEIVFGTTSCLWGLELIGFGVWMGRGGRKWSVTFPSRGAPGRSWALLRPTGTAGDRALRRAIIATVEAMGEQDRIECLWQKHPNDDNLHRVVLH